MQIKKRKICSFTNIFVILQPIMKSFMSQIWHSASARNVGKLLSANIIAQTIGLLVYPILTRLYSPEDFGLLNLFCSIGGVLILLAPLEWYNAIVLPERDEDARPVVHISLLAIAAITVLLVFSLPFAEPIAALFKSPDLAVYWWLLPIYVLLMSVWNVLNYWYIRRKAYGRISGYQVSQSLFSAGYKAGFGWLGFLNGGLIWSSILSPLCSLIISIALSARKHLVALLHFNWEECRQAAAKYANFPKYSTPRALLNNIVGQLPVLVLTPLFGTRLVGFWGMALMLAFVPISTISRALYQVLFQKTSESVNNRRSIEPFYRRFTLWTLVIVIPAFVLLWFILPSLTAWLLGAEWRVVGEYVRWLLPWLVCNILSSSTGFLPDIFFKQKIGLYFEILLAVSRVIGVGLGIILNSFEVAIAGYAMGSAIVNAAQYIWLMSLVGGYEKTLP